MIIFLLFVLIMLFIFIVESGKMPMGDCTCGGKYHYDYFDDELSKNIYKCNQCGNEVF